MNIASLTGLTNLELLGRLKQLVQSERNATAAVVAHLGEVEVRELYLEEGCSSLFTYCTQMLHLSEHAAYNRIEAARLARRIPAVLVALERGHVHLSAIRILSRIMTPENHRDLLATAKHRSKRELEELAARWNPQPNVATSVRKLPGSTGNASGAVHGVHDHSHGNNRNGSGIGNGIVHVHGNGNANVHGSSNGHGHGHGHGNANVHGSSNGHGHGHGHGNGNGLGLGLGLGPGTASADEASPAARSAAVSPLSPERYKVQFTISAATRDKLCKAQELLRHRIPGGDAGQVFELALEQLVRELEKAKFAATDRPRQRTRPTRQGSRSIPAAVKREVWQRDARRCAFVSANGIRCTERGRLEFDHVSPHADGGPPTVGNVRLLCRAHNHHTAREFFGLRHADNRAENASVAHSDGSSRPRAPVGLDGT